jgi:hypothetical protein
MPKDGFSGAPNLRNLIENVPLVSGRVSAQHSGGQKSFTDAAPSDRRPAASIRRLIQSFPIL